MTTVITLPHSRPLTRADLEQMPDDGHRYELLDGILPAGCPAYRVIDPDEPYKTTNPITPADVVRPDRR